MTDRPIIFSASMVRALLDGRKSQTRRVLKPQPPDVLDGQRVLGWKPSVAPYAPGDRLYVREAFTFSQSHDHLKPSDVPLGRPVGYEADQSPTIMVPGRLRPSIHMPRWASRLTLTVTQVRVQRLWEINEEDARAEGVEKRPITDMEGNPQGDWWFGVPYAGERDARSAFGSLWDSLHNPRGLCADDAPHGWDANPWIVALTFQVHRQNIDKMEVAP